MKIELLSFLKTFCRLNNLLKGIVFVILSGLSLKKKREACPIHHGTLEIII